VAGGLGAPFTSSNFDNWNDRWLGDVVVLSLLDE
jgi:hypothetical protein